MQFTAVVLLTLLVVKLLMLPNKVAVKPVVGKARWLMALGIAMLDLHFLLQYALGLRAMGVTQAVMVNLLLFIPCCWTISMALINLQLQGRVPLFDKLVGGIVWGIVIILLGTAIAIDGMPLLSDTRELYWAEVVSSMLYLTMQGHYAYRLTVNLRSMRLALKNFYDNEMDGMLMWMRYSTIVLMVMALMVPLLIFVRTRALAVFALFFFVGIFYMVDTFCYYMVSSAPKKMIKAEQLETEPVAPDIDTDAAADAATADAAQKPLEEATLQRVENAIAQWIDRGGYRKSSLNIQNASDEIGVPRYQLSIWLKQQGYTYSAWMTDLRIEEAKNVLKQHPDWNNEAVANHCGFNERTYFQKKFKEKTGLSPAEFIKSNV